MTTFAEVKQTRTYKRKLYKNFKIEGHMISPKFLVSALQCSVIGLENSRHTLHESFAELKLMNTSHHLGCIGLLRVLVVPINREFYFSGFRLRTHDLKVLYCNLKQLFTAKATKEHCFTTNLRNCDQGLL